MEPHNIGLAGLIIVDIIVDNGVKLATLIGMLKNYWVTIIAVSFFARMQLQL